MSRVTEGDCHHPPRKRKNHRGKRQGNEPFPGVQNDETAWPPLQVKVQNLIRQMVRVHQYSRCKSQRNGQQFAGERPDCHSCPSRQQRVICRPQIRKLESRNSSQSDGESSRFVHSQNIIPFRRVTVSVSKRQVQCLCIVGCDRTKKSSSRGARLEWQNIL